MVERGSASLLSIFLTFHVSFSLLSFIPFLLFDFGFLGALLSQGGRHFGLPTCFFFPPSFPLLPLPSPLNLFIFILRRTTQFVPPMWPKKKGAYLLKLYGIIFFIFFN